MAARGLLVAALVVGASAGLGGARPQTAKAIAPIVGPVLWNTVVSPELPSSDLLGVNCVSASDCWAVGSTSADGVTNEGLIENYNGTTWSVVASPSLGATSVTLIGVTCFGASDCWAVGSSGTPETPTNLIEHYNGTAWSLGTAPSFSAGIYSLLQGVTCVSATVCWAVGYERSGTLSALIEEYSAGAWSVATGAAISGAVDSEFAGVTCVSASECWAVGNYATVGDLTYPLAEEYTGSSWTLGSPVTPLGSSDTEFWSVSCVSATDCWSVGTSEVSDFGLYETLIEQYTASGWSVVSSYNPPTSYEAIHWGVTCVSATDCWAVGEYVDADFNAFPLIEQYNGTSWSGAYSPSPSDDAELVGVSCVSSADCVSVGVDFNAGQALIEQTYQPVATAYTPLNPFRLCDTRNSSVTGYSTECSGDGGIGQGDTLTFPVTGVEVNGESVPTGAQSVVVNVTAIDGTAGTFLTVFPAGSSVPTASNLNVDYATNQANLVVVALGAGGELSIYNSQGSLNVAVDVEGYFSAASGGAGLFHSMAPLRLCDTRSGMDTACSGTPLTAGAWQKVVVSGCPEGDPGCAESVPSDGTAEAVALNLTAVDGSSGTYLSVVPPNGSDACPTTTPSFSNLNVGPAHNLPNRVIVPLGPEQDVCVYNSLGTINFILDINGWFGDGSESTQGALYFAIPPTRICDTRDESVVDYSTECTDETLTPNDTLPVAVAGVDGVPVGGATPPVAVIANVTAVAGTSGTLFILYPAGISQPLASDLNINASQNIPNLCIFQLSASGEADLYNDLGTIDAIVDVAGWFQDPPTV
ncbi:MAG: hypothetical protein ABR977_04795 [Candidatus Dormibacteria bacterium]|jgi:hypothetical protein